MRDFVTVALLVLLFSGCASTRIVVGDVESHEKGNLTYRQLQDRLRGRAVHLILRDDRQFLGVIMGMARDSVRLSIDDGADSLVLSTLDVRRLERIDHTSGGILGFLGGTVGGFLLGAALGEVATPRGGEMRGLGVGLYAVGGAGIGLLGGTLYGASRGIARCYEFKIDSVAARTP